MKLSLFFLCIVLGSSLAQETRATDIPSIVSNSIAETEEWKGIIYWDSPLKVRGFYLSGLDEPLSPLAELKATLKAFESEVNLELPGILHPQCLFKDRYLFLKSKLSPSQTANWDAPCSSYTEWYELIEPSRISIVFFDGDSDFNFHFYGDLTLKLYQKLSSNTVKPHQDYGVWVIPEPYPNSPATAVIDTLQNNTNARFVTLPWEQITEKIANRAWRNTWEYPLNLSPQDTEALLAHLWTLGQFDFRFSFFSQNSTQLMSKLLQLLPRSTRSNSPFAKIALQTFTKDLPFYAELSLQEKLKTFRNHLSPEAAKLADQIIYTNQAIDDLIAGNSSVSAAEKSLALDVALETLKTAQPRSRRSQEVLIARTDFTLPSLSWEDMVHPEVQADPRNAHLPRKASVGFGETRISGSYQELNFRLLGHDETQSSDGYFPDTEFSVLDLKLRHFWNATQAPGHLRLGETNLFSIKNLERGYFITTGARPYWESNPTKILGEVRVGFARRVFSELEGALELESALGPSESTFARIGPAASLYARTPLHRKIVWRNELHGFVRGAGFGKTYARLGSDLRFLVVKNWALRGSLKISDTQNHSTQWDGSIHLEHEF